MFTNKYSAVFNSKRVYQLIKIRRIQSVIRKKKKKYANSTPQQVAENVPNRKFLANVPNEKWVTDVTDQIREWAESVSKRNSRPP